MAVVRVPGKLARRPGSRHNIRDRDPPVDRDILLRDPAGIQALQGLQHNNERHEDRGGRSAGHNRPVLPNRDYLYHLVHVRVIGALPRLSK